MRERAQDRTTRRQKQERRITKTPGTVLFNTAICIGILYLFGLNTGLALIRDAGQTGNALQSWIGLGMIACPLPIFIGTALLALKLKPNAGLPGRTTGGTT